MLVYVPLCMAVRTFIIALMLALFGLTLSGCGGGGSSGSGGTGGGGSGSGPSISVLSPLVVMVGVPQGATVYGKGFAPQSQVLIDGQPTPLTAFQPLTGP